MSCSACRRRGSRNPRIVPIHPNQRTKSTPTKNQGRKTTGTTVRKTLRYTGR